MPADGILVRPELLRRCLIDHGHVIRICLVCIGEFTSPQKRDTHILQVSGRNVVVHDGRHSLSGGSLVAVDIELRDRIDVSHGDGESDAC